MIDKKIHIFTIILLLMCFVYGCGINKYSKTEKFIDYNYGVENLSDEDAIKLVKEIVSFMDTGIETGEAVEGINGESFDYFKNKEDEDKLEIYHRNYIKDSAYNYLTAMYKITRFNSGMGKAKTGFEGGTIRYKLEAEEDYKILLRRNNEICIEAVFNKDSSLGDGMPDTDKGQIFLTLCDDNKWRISKISQWYDDLVFYELEEYIDEFFDSQNNVKEDYDTFIRDYGYDKNGNRISMQMLRYSLKDAILSSSSFDVLENLDDSYILEHLSKLATYIAYEEIYARHGKMYPKYSIEYNYFNGLSWYKENKEFSEDDLSDIERHNLEIIKSHLEEF
nr:YARHG domain-containing protein [uncultured Lachnoanaerobaculum sp.]